jgi:UDPglucose 6-dehydrogenase
MKTVVDKGFLEFSRSLDGIDKSTDMVFICVATPTSESGEADLSYVESSLSQASERLSAGSVVVMKSTVPIGTCDRLSALLKERNIEIVSNPEFLSEGNALGEFQNPSRIIVGADSEETQKRVMNLYQSIDAPKMMCGLTSAETIKHASNSFLALKLSFVNELARLCEVAGADTSEVTYGMSLDSRIGDKFLSPGPGWGGSCFPKDTREIVFTGQSLGSPLFTVEAAVKSNLSRINSIATSVASDLGQNLLGLKVAIWGLAFKANTDDTRDSPSIGISRILADLGAEVVVYDPMAKGGDMDWLTMADSPLAACEGASALLVLTEWPEFSDVEPRLVKERLTASPIIVDTRRVLDAQAWSTFFSKFRVIGQR